LALVHDAQTGVDQMRFIPKPYKIEDILVHLNETTEKHNGLGSKQFLIYYTKSDMSVKAKADAFGVSTDTWYSWCRKYEGRPDANK
jgi:hypothetical protein